MIENAEARFDNLCAGYASHFKGKGRRGRLLIPANFLQIIPNILLIEGFLRLARLIFLSRPEARRIWGEPLVSQGKPRRRAPKLKLCIRNDDALLPGVL